MKTSLFRILGSLVAATLASTAVFASAQASVTYSDKGTVALYEMVEAQYTSTGSHVLVLSNDTNTGVLQKINPATKETSSQLAFTAVNTDGSNRWDGAVDMAIAADGSFAYVVFNGNRKILAKVDLSSMDVVDYTSLSGGAVNSSTNMQLVSLEADDTLIRVIGDNGSSMFQVDTLDSYGGNTSIGVDAGVTNLMFAYDSRHSAFAYPNLAANDGRYVLADNGINQSPVFSSKSDLSAIAIRSNDSGETLYAGNDQRRADQLFRSNSYISWVIDAEEESFTLPKSFNGVRQIVVSDNAEQLVALSKNKKILRMPLGRGWFASLADTITVSAPGVTLGSDPLIAITPDGNTVTYLDENDNIINYALADNSPTVAQPVELAWYVRSETDAILAWSISPDMGDSTLTAYVVQCTNGKSNRFVTRETITTESRDITLTRDNARTIKCRVVVSNEVGNSKPSNVVKVTARGKRGPTPEGP